MSGGETKQGVPQIDKQILKDSISPDFRILKKILSAGSSHSTSG